MTEPRIRLVEFTNTFHLGGGEVQFVELLRGLPAHYDVSVHALEASGPLLEPVRALGHTPEVFPLAGSFVHPHTVRQVHRLARWLRAHRTDLVHVHDFYTTLLAVPAARLAGAKVVVGRLDLVHWHGRLRHAVLAALTHAASHVIANAEAVKDFLLQREGLPGRQVTVIRNGLDIARFDARRAAGPAAPLPALAPGPVAALVANMSHAVKRQEDFLEALALLRRQGLPVQALLVGDGARRAELEATARRLGLQGCTHFLGHRTDVPAVLARATLGVLCSKQEGLSNAVMEGMAAGLPMVVTDAGGNRELVRDGERGFVVHVQQPAELAQAIGRLCVEPERARRMGASARSFVEQELGLPRMVAAHDALFRRLVPASRKGSAPP